MNAPELIALLRSRPKACGRLGITFQFYSDDDQEWWWGNTMIGTDDISEVYRHAITGAAVNWCDEHGIEVERTGDGEYRAWVGSNFYDHETRLHALLAAIEASEETTT